jgi:hypothetical protein
VWNWVAIGLLAVAFGIALLAWVGRLRFGRASGGSARAAGRAFAVLDSGALLQAVSQLTDSTAARWVVSGVGFVLVVVGALLIFQWRRRAVAG